MDTTSLIKFTFARRSVITNHCCNKATLTQRYIFIINNTSHYISTSSLITKMMIIIIDINCIRAIAITRIFFTKNPSTGSRHQKKIFIFFLHQHKMRN